MSDREIEADELRRLMAAYQAGDIASFDRLYAALAPMLRRYLRGLTRHVGSAEDLLQETFLRLHKARHTYDPALPLLPWAYAIARYVFLMDRRRQRRTREAPFPAEEVQTSSPPPLAPAWAAYEVKRALGQLGPEARVAVVLHHFWGFRFDEIAARLGIKEGAARARAHRAMQALRRLVGRRAG